MASCPKCGREVSAKIHIPLSEANRLGKTTKVQCSCGESITYVQPPPTYSTPTLSHHEKMKNSHNDMIYKEMKRATKNHEAIWLIVVFIPLFLVAVCVGIFEGINENIGKGILGGIKYFFSFFVLSLIPWYIGAPLVSKEIRLTQYEYDSQWIQDSINNTVYLKRFLGYVILIASIIANLINGGFFIKEMIENASK